MPAPHELSLAPLTPGHGDLTPSDCERKSWLPRPTTPVGFLCQPRKARTSPERLRCNLAWYSKLKVTVNLGDSSYRNATLFSLVLAHSTPPMSREGGCSVPFTGFKHTSNNCRLEPKFSHIQDWHLHIKAIFRCKNFLTSVQAISLSTQCLRSQCELIF